MAIKVIFLITFFLMNNLLLAKREEFAAIRDRVNAAAPTWKAELSDSINYEDKEALRRRNGALSEISAVQGNEQPVAPVIINNRPRLLPSNSASWLDSINSLVSGSSKKPVTPVTPVVNKTYPESLDLTTIYPNCNSIKLIRDQGQCGSCWAFSTMNSISDRYCIANYNSGKPTQRSFAPQDVMECCTKCSDGGAPCDGGYMNYAMTQAKTTGISTGEEFGNNATCKPYFLSPKAKSYAAEPTCKSTCADPKLYTTPLATDRFKIPQFSSAIGETAMIAALNNGGSIAGSYTVYDDFYTYKSGIYTHVTGGDLGGHAVRIIGYGVDKGVKYWLVANSWGKNWGENGNFRIRRGTNECDIEKNPAYYAIF